MPYELIPTAEDVMPSLPDSSHTLSSCMKKGQRTEPLACNYVVGWTGFEPATP